MTLLKSFFVKLIVIARQGADKVKAKVANFINIERQGQYESSPCEKGVGGIYPKLIMTTETFR